VAWVIVTCASTQQGWTSSQINRRADEIRRVANHFKFDSVYELNFPTTLLDQVPVNDLVSAISNTFKDFEPEEVFMPHSSDVHTDHRMVFDAVSSSVKWFRHPTIKRVLAYETLSETEFAFGFNKVFRPNIYIDIETHLQKKCHAMEIYESELGAFPFPRSHEAICALATLRGATAGFKAAEAFELMFERS
jgi:LmbE family N-acetylglucosaminyl deacetylase